MQRTRSSPAAPKLRTARRLPPSRPRLQKRPSRRHFATAAPSTDPRFSSIIADVNRDAQLAQYPQAKLSLLESGMRVISEPSSSGLATIGVFIDAGSRYETAENNGVAHFAERLLFAGTSKRQRSTLGKAIENMGGILNASTSREQTSFTATVPKHFAPQAVELLGEMLTQRQITDQTVDTERRGILDALNTPDDDLQRPVFEYLHHTAYRQSPLARPIRGTAETVQNVTKAQVEQYISTHFTAPRMVIAAVGDIDHNDVKQLVETHFADVPSAAPSGLIPRKQPVNFVGSEIRIRDDDMPKAHVAIGFETAGANDPDHFALMVLQMMLGSFNALSATDQYSSNDWVASWANYNLADSVTPFNTVYSDTGLFGLYAVADCNRLNVISNDLLLNIIHSHTHVPEQQFKEAQARLVHSLLAQYEGTEATCLEMGRQMQYHNRRIHPVEIAARIGAIDEVAIQNVVRRFFYDQDFALAAVGPIWELPAYPILRKKTYTPYF